jgi:hypothetical protein
MLVVVFVDVELVVVDVVIELNCVVVWLANAAEVVTVSTFALLAIAAVVELEVCSIWSTTVVVAKKLFCSCPFVGIPTPGGICPVAFPTFFKHN